MPVLLTVVELKLSARGIVHVVPLSLVFVARVFNLQCVGLMVGIACKPVGLAMMKRSKVEDNQKLSLSSTYSLSIWAPKFPTANNKKIHQFSDDKI